MPQNGTPICEAKNVTVRFGGPEPRPAIEDVSLAVNAGEVVALLGPSGCGKSTLLRSLVGLIKPTSGQVLVHGQPLTGIHPGISIVFQNFALYPWLNVRENVQIALNGLGLDTASAGHSRGPVHRYGRPRRLRGGLSQGTLRRHEAARRHRPRPGARPGTPLHGRAVQRTGRLHSRELAQRSVSALDRAYIRGAAPTHHRSRR